MHVTLLALTCSSKDMDIVWAFFTQSGTKEWSCGGNWQYPFGDKHFRSCSSLFVFLRENLRSIDEVTNQGRSAAFQPADSQWAIPFRPVPPTDCLPFTLQWSGYTAATAVSASLQPWLVCIKEIQCVIMEQRQTSK